MLEPESSLPAVSSNRLNLVLSHLPLDVLVETNELEGQTAELIRPSRLVPLTGQNSNQNLAVINEFKPTKLVRRSTVYCDDLIFDQKVIF